MRIDRLDLTIGPFQGESLDLSGGDQGLHLIYGPNEAGKSTTLRTVFQFFRGIPERTHDNFLTENKNLRIGVLLRGRDGTTLDLVRRKGRGNTLLNPDGSPHEGAEARLARMLGAVGPEGFAGKFVFDHDGMLAGGKEVLSGKGDLGEVLFAAGTGLAGVSALRKQLEAEAEALFKKGGSKPRINEALARLAEANDARRKAMLPSSAWAERQTALKAAKEEKEGLEDAIDKAGRARNHATRIKDAFEPAARRAAVCEELDGLADAPRLAADFTDRRKTQESFLVPSQRLAAESKRKAEELAGECATLDVPEGLLAEAETIDDVLIRLGNYRQGVADLGRLEIELAQFESGARSLLRDLGRGPADLAGEGLEPLRLKAGDRAAVLDLANRREALLRGRDEARRDLEALEARVKVAAEKAGAAVAPRALDRLKLAFKAAQKLGDLEERQAAKRDELSRDDRAVKALLKKLGYWSGPAEEVEGLAVPPDETVERFRVEFEAAQGARDELARDLEETKGQARDTAAQLERSRLLGEVPTEASLAEARSGRDALWSRLKAGWDDALGAGFEQGVKQADETADRLRREAGRVADQARCLAEQGRLAARLDDLATRLREADARLEAVESRWRALWAALGVEAPGTPGEMLGWLKRHAELAARARSAQEKAGEVARLEATAAEQRRLLGDALAESGAAPAAPGETLAALIERGELAVKGAEREAKARESAVEKLEELRAEVPRRREETDRTAADWAAWETGWAEAMGRIGQARDAGTAEVNAVLERTAALFDALDKAEERRHALRAITAETNAYKSEVWTLADRVAPQLAIGQEFDPCHAVQRLQGRLVLARAAHQKAEGLRARLVEERQTLANAEADVADAEARLEALRQEAGCDSVEDLPAAEARAARRRALEKERAELDAGLRKLAAGGDLAAFLDEVEGTHPDELVTRLDLLDLRVKDLKESRARADQAIGRETALIEQMDGSARAAEAGQEAEDLRAGIKADVEQYARLKLALAVLRKAIERNREKTEGPVVRRASELFSKLTLGSFEGVRAGVDDDDRPVLQGLRAGSSTPVSVDGLSLGTADQLFFALRLAALESYLDRQEPLPLIVDDVFIQFDNGRAAATLEVLAELSRRTQVLVFTHHEHLVALANERLRPDVLINHALPGRTPALHV